MQEEPTSLARRVSETALPVTHLTPEVLRSALTPHGLFTNLFPVAFPSSSLGSLKQTTKAAKEDFADRKRPAFYQSGDILYAYGSGLEEFKDGRFTPAIVPVETEPDFARHLLKIGIAEWFRERGYLVRIRRVGVSVIDHTTPIAEAESRFLSIFPEFTFQAQRTIGAEGNPIYCFSIEPAWATVPAFEVGPRVRKRSDLLERLKVVLKCSECVPRCPLYDQQNRIIGTFQEFADSTTELTTACKCEDYTPQPVRIKDCKRLKGGTTIERFHVVPGQVVQPAAGQRQVLRLFSDRSQLEREGRIWLGDLTKGGNARVGALQVRYERIQHFLARTVESALGPLVFSLPTGPRVALQRIPLTVEELTDV